MNLSGNTVLITGGGTGIGLGLVAAFIQAGSTVIICGRRQSKLDEAQRKYPALHTFACDLGNPAEREKLSQWVQENFPQLNVLVNNAGIQRHNNFLKGADMASAEEEINTNMVAPIHLCSLFIPQLLPKENSAIINVSSGLGFIPIARMPVYCATKAAVHFFTWSLRRQLRDTSVRVFELIPPIVDTELDRGTRPAEMRGISTEEFVTEAMQALRDDVYEAPAGMARGLYAAARSNPEEAFDRMNG